MNRIKSIIGLLLCAAVLTGFGSGCRDLEKGGVYSEDKVLYNAELSVVTAYELLHAFVTWEKDNRQALAAQPEIRKAADNIRAHSKEWFDSAHRLRDAYAANPTDENRNNLTAALGIIRAALTEASGYMVKTATSNQ